MSNINFTVKVRRSGPDGLSIKQLIACKSVEIEHPLNDGPVVILHEVHGSNRDEVFQIRSQPKDQLNINTTYCEEIIIENMAGKTTERYYVNPSIDEPKSHQVATYARPDVGDSVHKEPEPDEKWLLEWKVKDYSAFKSTVSRHMLEGSHIFHAFPSRSLVTSTTPKRIPIQLTLGNYGLLVSQGEVELSDENDELGVGVVIRVTLTAIE